MTPLDDPDNLAGSIVRLMENEALKKKMIIKNLQLITRLGGFKDQMRQVEQQIFRLVKNVG
jgi:hypothetical protein